MYILRKGGANNLLTVNHITCGYGNKMIIKDVSFSVSKGKMLCIIGPNGSGKSTLLKAFAHLIDYKGSVTVANKEISRMTRKELATKVALLSQVSQVYFPYTVYETIALGRYAYNKGIFNVLTHKDREMIDYAIGKVGLEDQKDKMINELSGGQLQRVFFARVLVQDPEIILLDEPTNHLDLKYQIELLNMIKEWAITKQKVVIGVLHDLNLVQEFADEVILLNEGNMVKRGNVGEVLQEEILQDIYGINIRAFMIRALKNWQ